MTVLFIGYFTDCKTQQDVSNQGHILVVHILGVMWLSSSLNYSNTTDNMQ